MTKHHIYAGGFVNYDHTALYIVIGIIAVVMVVTLVGYAVYAYRKKKKMEKKSQRIQNYFPERKKRHYKKVRR